MAESLMKPLLMLTAFFAVLVVVLSQFNSILSAGEQTAATSSAPPLLIDAFEDLNLIAWEPNPFEVSSSDQVSWFAARNPDPMVSFEPAGGDEHPLSATLVRNATWGFDRDTDDFIVFHQHYGWLGSKVYREWISFDEILEAYLPDQNFSRIFLAMKYNFEVFFYADEPLELPYWLWYNDFNITVGYCMNSTPDSMNPWTLVGKIMTFSMPGTPWYVNAMIATPIYMMMFYLGYELIRRCIPLLP